MFRFIFQASLNGDLNKPETTELKKIIPKHAIDLSALEGSRCRVPHQHKWGQHQYHNAMIVCPENLDEAEEPKVIIHMKIDSKCFL